MFSFKIKNKLRSSLVAFSLLLTILVVSTNLSYGIAPLTDDQIKELRTKGKLDSIVKITYEFNLKNKNIESKLTKLEKLQLERDALGTGSILVLLCEFEDNLANQTTHDIDYYDRLFFSQGEMSTGSIRDYYQEASYGKYDIEGGVSSWHMMPETYSYYVDGNYGFNSYPQNAEKMVEELIILADDEIDYSQYDNDGPDGIPNSGDDDGYIDAIFVVHAGPEGAGGGGSAIWSHASYLWHNRPEVDGVKPLRYTVTPENSNIGVYCHEYGHTLGLPDLYDTDYSSDGVGSWSIMGAGSHTNNGKTPSHFDSWCKLQLGWLEPIVLTNNTLQVEFPQFASNDFAYLLWTDGEYNKEYFLVENRQKTLFDSYLPGGGLLIWHIDDSVNSNNNEDHPKVHLEQADGREDLSDRTGSRGDPGDCYPGTSGNRFFNLESTPNSRNYDGNVSHVGVENISNSMSIMTADLYVNQPLSIDAPVYSCDATIEVAVINKSAEGQGTISVLGLSTTETDGETFDLFEDPENLGIFSNQLQLEASPPIIDSKIQVKDGDIVTIQYNDSESGIEYEQSAFVDCIAPNLVFQLLNYTSPNSINLKVDADENSSVSIEYGTTPDLGYIENSTDAPTKINEIILTDLESCTIYYYIIILTDVVGNQITIDDNGVPFHFETRMDKQVGLTHLATDFEEQEPQLWIHESADNKVDEWELGTPEMGPETAYSGDNCWGTDLDEEYDESTDSWLVTPEIDLTQSFNPQLHFWHWYNITVDGTSGDDGAWVEISTDGRNWFHIEPMGGYPEFLDPDAPYNPSRETEDLIGVYAGNTEDWEQAVFSLKKFRGFKIKIRFHIWQDDEDNMGLLEGWYIDDVTVFDENFGICHKGELEFLSVSPNCSFDLPVYLGDNDLNQDPNSIDSYGLKVNISSTPEVQDILLNESDVDTGMFFGTIYFSKVGLNGIQVEDGDSVNADYIDENPGIEGSKTIHAEVEITCKTSSISNFFGKDVSDDNGGKIQFRWHLSPDDGRGENDVEMYVLLRADADIPGLLDFEPIQEIQPGIINTIDENAIPTKAFFYVLQTVDYYGNSANSQRIGPLTGTDNIEPETPTNFKATDLGIGDSIFLEWDHEVSEQTDGYIILFDTDSGWPYLGRNSSLGDSPIKTDLISSVVISGLQTDTEYYFAIRAKESSGVNSLLSEEISATPTMIYPPIILAGGFAESFTQIGGSVIVQALVQYGTNPVNRVEVFYKGVPTGINLDETWSDGSNAMFSGSLVVQPSGEFTDKLVVELVAYDGLDTESEMWPYLNVPASGNEDDQQKVYFGLNSDFPLPQDDSNIRPRVLLGGFWDTKLDPKNPSNLLKMVVLVNHKNGLDQIEKVAFYTGTGTSDITFNDDGQKGDNNAGDGIFTFQTEITEYPLPGLFILPVIAKDKNGSLSNMFPYINIVN